ncbi:MAG TPA: hypothetical protein VL172_06950 [Kofleriaceae bacterium]|nr:hypothetical protein [Kofleriaceae bacterium]
MRRILVLAGWLAVAASCNGNVKSIDGGAGPAIDVTSNGGHMIGGRYTLDFQVGHPLDQGKAAGGTVRLKGNAAVSR